MNDKLNYELAYFIASNIDNRIIMAQFYRNVWPTFSIKKPTEDHIKKELKKLKLKLGQ